MLTMQISIKLVKEFHCFYKNFKGFDGTIDSGKMCKRCLKVHLIHFN